jgi:hypothetical protein
MGRDDPICKGDDARNQGVTVRVGLSQAWRTASSCDCSLLGSRWVPG